MTQSDILRHRLQNQQLNNTKFKNPQQMVEWFGAMQAQDYPGARWAVGQRIPGATDELLEKAFNDGSILRTHVMRPTWHFVAPVDIRWMLKLTAPRVNAVMGYYNRILGLDDNLFKKSRKAFANALKGDKYLTRLELSVALKENGILVKGQKLAHIVMDAELAAVICSGPKRGKQFTYALLEERAPKARVLSHDEALSELTKKYFRSHGPATLQDFVWWSGLKTSDARLGIETLKGRLIQETIDNNIYWFFPVNPPKISQVAYLLPNYDEYTIAYKMRDAYYPSKIQNFDNSESVPFAHTVIMEGQIVAMWKQTLTQNKIVITIKPLNSFTKQQLESLELIKKSYSKFLNLPVSITLV